MAMIKNASRSSGFFTVEAALSQVLLLSVFFMASNYAAYSSISHTNYSARQLKALSLIHISDYLVKDGAACACAGAPDCSKHHCLDENALFLSFEKFKENPSDFGFDSLGVSLSLPQFHSASQFCVSRDYLSNGAPARAFVCGW